MCCLHPNSRGRWRSTTGIAHHRPVTRGAVAGLPCFQTGTALQKKRRDARYMWRGRGSPVKCTREPSVTRYTDPVDTGDIGLRSPIVCRTKTAVWRDVVTSRIRCIYSSRRHNAAASVAFIRYTAARRVEVVLGAVGIACAAVANDEHVESSR